MAEDLKNKVRVKSAPTPRELLFNYIRYLPWVIVCVGLCLFAAYVKLRYTQNIYKVEGKLQVNSETPYAKGNDKFNDIFMMQQGDKINDEVEFIKSRSLAARVVEALGLQLQVQNIGKINSMQIHRSQLPFYFNQLTPNDSLDNFRLQLDVMDDDTYLVENDAKPVRFGDTLSRGNMRFVLYRTDVPLREFTSNKFQITWNEVELTAATLSKSISVSRVNDFSNVINFSYLTPNVPFGLEIVDQYMKEYQSSNLEDKRLIASKTLNFIDEQLDTVFKELGGVERNLQQFREQNQLYSPAMQTELFFSDLSETNKQMIEQGISIKVTEYLSNYLSEKKNRFNVIPSALGIQEPTFLQQVGEFNKLQLDRETALKRMGAQNPAILALESSIEKLRLDMVENLRNLRQTQTWTIDELNKKNRQSGQMINAIPSREKRLLEVTRQQNILQELYQFLLQKKLETSIASASTISNIKVVESAMAGNAPVSPNRKVYYVIALLLGVALPVVVFYFKEYLDDKVKSRYEVEQLTTVPILGEIGHSQSEETLVAIGGSRKILAEQFRIIRSNIQYILPKKEKPVILVTSSFGGEGKSFIATNLGAVLALSGKKTLILEFDIRKPKILKGLNMSQAKGITNYIISGNRVEEYIIPVKEVNNLFVLPCGPIPPNPAEILLDERIAQLFAVVKQQYDVVIIDSAPVGLVSDSIVLGAYADATIYVVRHNYTLKRQLYLPEDIYLNKKMPPLAIIINDIHGQGSYGGYYGYSGYGYGYGYGYAYGGKSNKKSSAYFDIEEKSKRKNLFRTFLQKNNKS